MKYMMGDKVRLHDKGIKAHQNGVDDSLYTKSELHKIEGIVVVIKSKLRYPIYVEWNKYLNGQMCYDESELILVDEFVIDVDELFEDIEL